MRPSSQIVSSTNKMLTMASTLAFGLLFFCSFTLTGAVQESVTLLTLSTLNPTHNNHLPLAVLLPIDHLNSVSSSLLEAEKWLITNVLSNYPSSNITQIAVGHNLHCTHPQILPSLKNLHYSLTRWGLQAEIKVSPSVSSQCLDEELFFKPLMEFIHTTNSTYLVNPPHPFPAQTPNELHGLVSSHLTSMRKFGPFNTNHIKLILQDHTTKPTSRKLSSYPTRPTPLLSHLSPSPHIAKTPLPPLIGSTLPPLSSFPFPPAESPVTFPGPPPSVGGFHHPPPCNPSPPSRDEAAAPGIMVGGERLWCVAKPSVPADTLQESVDFACGEGGADCEEIQPKGKCYSPDTVVAHASYAFNSYWQTTKREGGTCDFGGTAMIINADPSFLNCKFIAS